MDEKKFQNHRRKDKDEEGGEDDTDEEVGYHLTQSLEAFALQSKTGRLQFFLPSCSISIWFPLFCLFIHTSLLTWTPPKVLLLLRCVSL